MQRILLSEKDNIPSKYLTLLKKQKIETVEDLLYSYPNRFEDYTIVAIDDVVPDTPVTISAICQSKAIVINTRTKLSVMNFYVESGSQKLKVTIFNRHFLKSKIGYGIYVRFMPVSAEHLGDLVRHDGLAVRVDGRPEGLLPGVVSERQGDRSGILLLEGLQDEGVRVADIDRPCRMAGDGCPEPVDPGDDGVPLQDVLVDRLAGGDRPVRVHLGVMGRQKHVRQAVRLPVWPEVQGIIFLGTLPLTEM